MQPSKKSTHCTTCCVFLDENNSYKRRGTCKKCTSAKGKLYYYNTLEARREANRRQYIKGPQPKRIANPFVEKDRFLKKLGEQKSYKELLSAQNYVCAISKRKETKRNNSTGEVRALSIDHCHLTGRYRGLICSAYNVALGMFDDDPLLLAKAIVYLLKFSENPFSLLQKIYFELGKIPVTDYSDTPMPEYMQLMKEQAKSQIEAKAAKAKLEEAKRDKYAKMSDDEYRAAMREQAKLLSKLNNK